MGGWRYWVVNAPLHGGDERERGNGEERWVRWTEKQDSFTTHVRRLASGDGAVWLRLGVR